MTGAVIDLDRYPLDDLRSEPGQALVRRCRDALDRTGACELPGFVKPEAVQALVAEARAAAATAHRSDDSHNVYFEAADPDRGDVFTMMQHSAKLTVAWDQVLPSSPLRTLYGYDAMTDFLGAVLDTRLHRYADSLGACSLALFEPGDELGWHFDRAEFAVTLMLAPAETGGEFEWVHELRTDSDPNHEGVAELLRGSVRGLQRLANDSGTLSLFRGRRSPHRVTPVAGERLRINAVLAYADKPEQRLNPLTQQLFYGRVEAGDVATG